MKFLFYSPVRLQNGGGCERWHCDITNSLKHRFGDEVEIVTGNLGRTNWTEDYLKQELRGIPYQMLKYPVIFGVLIPTPKIILELYHLFKQADSVHMIFGFMGQDVLFLTLKLITGKRLLVGHHAPIFHSSKIHNWYISHVSRYLMPYFDNHQTLNSSDRNYFRKVWNIKNVYFIPSGIRVDRFLPQKKARHRSLIFLSVGRYAPQKGFDLELEAISIFNKKYPQNQAIFRFVGGGELKGLISDYSKKFSNVMDLGYVKYEVIPKIYSGSDVYLLCSREEPFGLVLIEAWSSGLPVLATKTEGPRDMLRPLKNGWFINRNDPQAMASSIEQIYCLWKKNPLILESMQQECVSTARKYSIDITAQKMRKLLQHG